LERFFRVLYSPVDAVKVAEENPDKEVIFWGIGFETTISILALMVGEGYIALDSFGYWSQNTFTNELRNYHLNTKVASLITQVKVK
jgi:hydrogenase expression/formation protein HypD